MARLLTFVVFSFLAAAGAYAQGGGNNGARVGK